MKVVKKKKNPAKTSGRGKVARARREMKRRGKNKRKKKNEDNSLPKHLTWITQTRASTTRHSKTKLHQKQNSDISLVYFKKIILL